LDCIVPGRPLLPGDMERICLHYVLSIVVSPRTRF
jgi:hypothetical protein